MIKDIVVTSFRQICQVWNINIVVKCTCSSYYFKHLYIVFSPYCRWNIAHLALDITHLLIYNQFISIALETSQSSIRRFWRYQRGNQKVYIEELKTTEWPKEKVRKDKQRSTKHTHKTKDRVARTPLKIK
jgi:hypothetical protein